VTADRTLSSIDAALEDYVTWQGSDDAATWHADGTPDPAWHPEDPWGEQVRWVSIPPPSRAGEVLQTWSSTRNADGTWTTEDGPTLRAVMQGLRPTWIVVDELQEHAARISAACETLSVAMRPLGQAVLEAGRQLGLLLPQLQLPSPVCLDEGVGQIDLRPRPARPHTTPPMWAVVPTRERRRR
jgi:hypothetical protein